SSCRIQAIITTTGPGTTAFFARWSGIRPAERVWIAVMSERKNAGVKLAHPLTRPIVLVGLMGAGKTTIGRRLAAKLGLRFVDSAAEVENAGGRSIPEIFEDFGEAEFRDGERKVIARLLGEGPMVLATGGGAFMASETRARVKASGISIWLKADIPL